MRRPSHREAIRVAGVPALRDIKAAHRRCVHPGITGTAHPPQSLRPRSKNPRMRVPRVARHLMRKLPALLLVLVILALAGCGYDALVRSDEELKASWSDVGNQTRARTELASHLVEIVEGDSAVDRAVVAEVIEARMRVAAMPAMPSLVDDPKAFERFERAQDDLDAAVTHLLAVADREPAVAASLSYRNVRSHLQDARRRVDSARRRCAEAARIYGQVVHGFPSNLTALAFGFREKATYSSIAGSTSASSPPTSPSAGAR